MTNSELIRDLELYVKADRLRQRWGKEVSDLTDTVNRLKYGPILKEEPSDDQCSTALLIAAMAAFLALWLFGLAAAILTFGIAFLIIAGVFQMDMNAENKRTAEQHKKEATKLPELERRLEIALTKQKEANNLYARARQYASKHLPDTYMYGYCAERFLSYLKNGRADTLKEAINLYEIESRQDAIYEENRRHNEEMERQQQRQTELASEAVAEASRAADASEEAARSADFWGAVNTYQLEEILHKE